MNRFKQLWINLRSSFWFLPTLIVFLCILTAVMLIEIETKVGDKWVSDWPRLFGADPDGARGMMSTIAGSMMTVVGVVFSMVLVVLTLAASQYTSRVLRSLMRSRVTQVVLGIYAGIFVYSLIVLRTIRGHEETTFVPELAVFFSFVLALGSIGALVLFIHHISTSIQASSILASVANETFMTIDHMFPEDLGHGLDSDHKTEIPESLDRLDWQEIASPKTGYIQSVNSARLLKIAEQKETIIRMHYGIGQFIDEGAAMVSIAGADQPDKKTLKALQDVFGINKHRTVDQDAGFGIRQIVDVALKALSPGINDITTAVMCLDYLTAILKRLVSRRIPSLLRYNEDKLRIIAKGPDFQSLTAESYDQIRHSAKGNVTIMIRILDSIEEIGQVATNSHRRGILSSHVERISELARSSLEFKVDIELVEQRLAAARAAIESNSAVK